MVRPSRSLLFCLALSLICTATGSADSPFRFVSLQPTGTPGEWVAVVSGKGVAKSPGSLAFRADGAPVTAQAEPSQGDQLRVRLQGVPAGVSRIEVGTGKKAETSAAVRVGPRDPAKTPWAEWTIYHVMVSMFANGTPSNDGEIDGWKHPNYAGGDLQGVLQRAAHIQELGATAVWLSPVFASRSSHGYDVTNYYRIGDQFAVPDDPAASLDLFRRLVQDLRGRGIRVILDIPLNHASSSYQRPEGEPDGLRPRATSARQEAEKVWEGWGSNLRFWDFDHAPTRQFLENAVLHWLRQGVDGFRLDYVRGVPHDFWSELYGEVKRARPDAFLVGEAWIDQQGAERNMLDIATYYERTGGGPQLDSLLDFPLQIGMTAAFAQGGSAADLERLLQETEAAYGPDAVPTYFLDNHDMARFMAWADRPERLTAAVGFLASLSGPIVLFYGTETGLAHAAPKSGFTDVGRLPMPWQGLDAGLAGRVRDILQARRRHPALSRGGRLPLAADKDLLVMAKVTPEETALVGVNLSSQPRELDLDVLGLLPKGAQLAPVVGPSAAAVAETGRLRWTLPPLSTSIVAKAGRE